MPEVSESPEDAALPPDIVPHFIGDEDKPAELVATLCDALPPGSYLVASHITAEHIPAGAGYFMTCTPWMMRIVPRRVACQRARSPAAGPRARAVRQSARAPG
jgi:hypothetical protein